HNAERKQDAPRRGEFEKQAFQQPGDQAESPTHFPHSQQAFSSVIVEIEVLQLEEGTGNRSSETIPLHLLPEVPRILTERAKKVGFVFDARLSGSHCGSESVTSAYPNDRLDGCMRSFVPRRVGTWAYFCARAHLVESPFGPSLGAGQEEIRDVRTLDQEHKPYRRG